MTAEGQHLHVRRGLPERFCGFQAVHPGHRYIENNDVGLELADAAERRGTIARFADDLHVGLSVKEELETFPNGLVIVGEEDARLLGGGHDSSPWARPPRTPARILLRGGAAARPRLENPCHRKIF